MSRTTLLALVTLAVVVPSDRARAGVVAEEHDDGLTVFKMTVTPAAEPVPALAHRLTLRELDGKNGNAVPYYYRAILNVDRIAKEQRDKYGEEFDQWYYSLETPLEQLPLDKLRAAAAAFETPLDALREAAQRRDCNWDWQLESIRGASLFSFLLPEIQSSRELSRAVMLHVRLAIAEKRYDDAIELLRINYKLASDIAVEPLLINALVGVAEAGMGHRELVELIAAPGSPNMYWAIAELPQPFIDMRRATRFEMSSTFRVFPVMNDAENAEHSPEEWARLFAEGLTEAAPFFPGGMTNEETARLGVTALSLTSYGPAKQRLIDGGFDAERVERMPVGQVIAIDAGREFRKLANDMEKWWYTPYTVARTHTRDVDQALGRDKFAGGFGKMLAALLLPALSSARESQMRLEWQTGGLQTVEAIRMHAAAVSGLPASLDEIKVVPVPENPVTGKPYQYRREGDVAIVELPATDGFSGAAWRFEISLAK